MIYTIAIVLAIIAGAYVWNLFEPPEPSTADDILLARRDYYFAAIQQDHRHETWAYQCLQAIAVEFQALHCAADAYERALCERVILRRMDYRQAMNLIDSHRVRVEAQLRRVERSAPMDSEDMK